MNLWKVVAKLNYRKFSAWMWLIFLCPIIVMLLALIVLGGWIGHHPQAVQVLFSPVPMQFNTALCFLCCSSAFLIGLSGAYHGLRIALALATCIIAVINIVQYSFNADLGIDLLFIKPFIVTSIHPGRMSPNTALAFIFISLSLILFSPHLRLSRYRALIISLFASISLALGVVPLLGYLTHIETAYTWDKLIATSLTSAFCLVLLSVATIAYIWSRSEEESNWLPIPIFMAFLMATFFMSLAVYNKEVNKFNQILENNTQNAAIMVQKTLENLIQALGRMANRWEVNGAIARQLWHTDAQAYLHDFSYLLALEILNKDLKIQLIEPTAGNTSLIGKNLNMDQKRKKIIQQAINTKKPTISDILTLKQGGKGFLCFIPLYTNNHFSGMLVAVFRADDFFNSIFTNTHFSSHYATIYEHGKEVFTNSPQPKTHPAHTPYHAIIYYQNVDWFITLTPTAQTIAQKGAPSYLIVFYFGLLMTILVTSCLYLILKWNEQSKALYDSEHRYKMILDSIKDYAIFMLTPLGHVKSWNKGAQRVMGYIDKEIVGKHCSIFHTPEDIAQGTPMDILAFAKQHGKYEGESKRLRKDGTQFWAHILIEPVYNANRQLAGFVKITRDVTDSRQMEEERSKLIALIEESSDFVGIADLQGNLQYHNRSAKRMVGLPENYDLSDMTISQMHPEWVIKKINQEILPAAFENGFWTGETALLHQSGREIPVLQSINLHRNSMGEPICLTTIMRDITERKAEEDATKASEEIFRSAMQHASTGMALISTTGKWLKVNHALCNMLGYSEEELLTIDFQTITHPEDLESDLDNVLQMLNKQIDSYQMEKRYFHKDGHIIWGLLNVSLAWDNDIPKYFISQIQNITYRKETEAANKKLLEALANSNSELERFAYVASHDLQEPIRMINSFGELLLTEKQDKLDDEAKEYLSIMTNAGIRMRDVINDLLAYSRLDKENITHVHFSGEEILKSALENIKALIEEQKAQITHAPLPPLYGNPMQIMRLLQNLMINAIKYQPPGNQPIIHIEVVDQGKNWDISVKDNGLGIEEQFIKEIFEPFRRLHAWESIKGSGLGLSICKKIAERHGGTLSVTSIVGMGSIFTLTLPKDDNNKGDS